MGKKRYNKSKTYLLPLLSEIVNFDKKFFKNLKNTYIYDDLNMYNNCIYILHDFSFKNPEFTAYEHKLIKNDLFVDLIDIEDKVLYIFKFPEEYLNEYNNFINGAYSKFEEDAKDLILNYYTEIYSGNPNVVPFLVKVKNILEKSPVLREELEEKLKIKINEDAELQDIIKKEDETFNLSKYIKDNDNKSEVSNLKMK